MSSALAMWGYHRRLSMEAENRPSISIPETAEQKRIRTKSLRSDSEASSTLPDRRVSFEDEEVDHEHLSGEEEQEHDQPREPAKRKFSRRFSLDVLFGKRNKKQKDKEVTKEKRSQSIAPGHTGYEKNPGLAMNDFSMFYFI